MLNSYWSGFKCMLSHSFKVCQSSVVINCFTNLAISIDVFIKMQKYKDCFDAQDLH